MDVVAGWVEEITGPLALGVAAVALTWVLGRSHPRRGVLVAGISAGALLVLRRERYGPAIEALFGGPAWWAVTAALVGVVVSGAIARLAVRGRPGEGLALLGVGTATAAAALPDVEVVVGTAALWACWIAAPRHGTGSAPTVGTLEGPGPSPSPGDRCIAVAAALAIATTAVLALVEGARGRPGSLLVAPVVVGPVAIASLIPPPRDRWGLAARVAVVGVVGLVVARLAGLGAGTARPLLGSLAGLALLGAATIPLLGGRADTEDPPPP